MVMPDLEHEATTPLPKRSELIEIGETISYTFPYNEGSFLRDENLVQIGVVDAFGRHHYCSRGVIRRLKKGFREEFCSQK